jgi:predicted DNA-binding transcriptional regulator AlpA
MEQLLSPRNLADVLGISEQTIYNRHSTGGDLPPTIKLGRLIRFRPTDVESWLKSHQTNEKSLEKPAIESIPKRRGRPTKAEQMNSRKLH